MRLPSSELASISVLMSMAARWEDAETEPTTAARRKNAEIFIFANLSRIDSDWVLCARRLDAVLIAQVVVVVDDGWQMAINVSQYYNDVF